ncbi:hypothetical protein [Chengkuizengella sediminis]|uniref:hypothetical protein n=1 Tax=Chengkuizengella sediminis TaxID=1885917 RepID=UPI0013894BD8|nr:hypothetical protein [Chengkuizengella sediminis]NDI34710.1 hypothetical protein [Chengkuizengella sediminis]
MWKKIFISILVIFTFNMVFLVFEEISASTFTEKEKNKVIVVSIPSLSFYEFSTEQLQALPSFSFLFEQSRVGAVNMRTSGTNINDVYVTLGAGVPTESRSDIKALNVDEKIDEESAQVLYFRYVGSLHTDEEILVPEISLLYEMNENNRYQTQIGLLGETLKQNEKNIFVYGNRDRGIVSNESYDGRKRSVALMLMDQWGLIPYGNIGAETLTMNENRPFSIQTNYQWIYEQLSNVKTNSMILIELGDLDRLYVDKSYYLPERFQQLKQEILKEMDKFLGKIITEMNPEDALFVFSPQVHRDAKEEKLLLTPIIYYDHQITPGLLTSSTTKRNGILSHVDIAPSLLNFFQISIPVEMMGNIMISEDNDQKDIHWLAQELVKIQNIYQLRPKLLYSFVTFEVIVLIASLFVVLRGWNQGMQFIKPFLLSLLIAPLVMLWMGYFSGLSSFIQIVFFLLVTFLLSMMFQYFSIILMLTIISFSTSFMILLDGLFGAYAMKHSVLGYDVMIGARYYGIGNEFMGVLIGSTALAATMIFHMTYLKYERVTKWLITSYFLIVIFYLGAPFLGTNAGGTITAIVTFSILWIRCFKEKWLRSIHWMKLAVFCGILGFVSLSVLWVLNDVLITDQNKVSHIGKAMNGLFGGNVQQTLDIVIRKISMNWHLIQVSAWSKVFLTSLVVIVLFVLKPKGRFQKWHDKYYSLMIGFSSITIGTIAVFFLNDSGIVAAATMIVYVAIPMLLLKLNDGDNKVEI